MDKNQREEWLKKRKEHKASLSVDAIFEGIQNHDRFALSAGITLIESQLESDKVLANELIRLCLPFSGKSKRIGITGVPGVGKSTFIEAFGKIIIEQGHKIAVLTIDPSSAINSSIPLLGLPALMRPIVKNKPYPLSLKN